MIAQSVPVTIPARTSRGLSTSISGFVFLVILGVMLAEHDLAVVVERLSDLDKRADERKFTLLQ